VDEDCHRQGYVAELLRFALKTGLRASESIGAMGVIIHLLDDGAAGSGAVDL
jgi:hypothetical protein